VLGSQPDIEVVDTAMDPYMGREKIARCAPDVVTLDIEMPRLDGLSFLEALMKHHPIPVVVISSLTPERSDTAIRALELGAIDVIPKPGGGYTTPDLDRVITAVRAAAAARGRVGKHVETRQRPAYKPSTFRLQTTHKIIAIGASTGGTKAIEAVLTGMPPNAPGTVIVQHMPEHFTTAFAKRLDGVCNVQVREACDGDAVVPGLALIAPGNKHMVLVQSGAKYLVRLNDCAPVNYQRPSVDVLFDSVAQAAGRNALGVLLTGMGTDGAKGLMSMKESGARTVVEDENTCVVFGMPKEAIRLGAADQVVPINEMAHTILSHFE
jgi:two-component system chemotaxis response regulator CheB